MENKCIVRGLETQYKGLFFICWKIEENVTNRRYSIVKIIY